MKIIIVQHGQALPKDIDPDRSLSPEGCDDIQRLGAFIKGKVNLPQVIFHSGKTRALQTARILAEELECTAAIEEMSGISPNDPPEVIAKQLFGMDQDLMIVSHLPFVARLVSELVVHDSEQTMVEFEPGTALCLQRDDDKNWSLKWMLPVPILV